MFRTGCVRGEALARFVLTLGGELLGEGVPRVATLSGLVRGDVADGVDIGNESEGEVAGATDNKTSRI